MFTYKYRYIQILLGFSLVLGLFFIGCRTHEKTYNDNDKKQSVPSVSVEHEPADEKGRLEFYRKKWEQYEQKHYSIKFLALCNCSYRTAHNFREEKVNGKTEYKKDVWLLIEVEEGAIKSVTLESGVREMGYAITLENKSPIIKAFELIDLAIARKEAKFTIEYDQNIGYPHKIDIDFSGAVDNEFQIELKDFKLLDK